MLKRILKSYGYKLQPQLPSFILSQVQVKKTVAARSELEMLGCAHLGEKKIK